MADEYKPTNEDVLRGKCDEFMQNLFNEYESTAPLSSIQTGMFFADYLMEFIDKYRDGDPISDRARWEILKNVLEEWMD